MKTKLQSLIFISTHRKARTKTWMLFILLISVMWVGPQKASAQVQVAVNFQIFYDELSPYGYWVDNPDYGYVWVPDVPSDFTPYGSGGHWIYAYEGWTWVSDYPWGWAPFHYGRWFYDSYYGWEWMPDSEWSPGWVTWRRSNDYYGWAPIGPGIAIDLAYSNNYNVPYNSWRFVRNRDFGRTNIYNYYVNSSDVTVIVNNSTVINNIREDKTRHVRYNAGPDKTDAERRAGKTFNPITIKANIRAGQHLDKNQLEIYRPQIQKNISGRQKPAPLNVVSSKDVQPISERKAQRQPNQWRSPIQQPDFQHPKKEQPIKWQRDYQQPKTEQPVKQEPNYQMQKEQPVRQQRDYQQQREQRVKQQPVYQQQKEQPIRQQRDYQQPKKEQPVRQQQRKDNPPKKKNGYTETLLRTSVLKALCGVPFVFINASSQLFNS